MSIDLRALAKRAGGTFDGRNALIPGPGHSTADRSLSVSIGDHGRPIWWSFAGDDGAAVRAHLKTLGMDVSTAQASPDAPPARERGCQASATARLAADLWRQSMPIVGTIAARYLVGRAIAPPYPCALRFHPRCLDGPFHRPALIAARTLLDAPDQVSSIQRTFLDASGRKIKRLSLGECRRGGVVLGELGEELLIAEGVETALSAAAMLKMPAVATTGASGFGGLIIPGWVRRVVVAADNDERGLRAAHHLAVRLRKEGCEVRIETPLPAFKDFNDQVQTGATNARD